MRALSQELDEVITEIKKLWPGCAMVRGRARHSESQGGVERLNRTCQDGQGLANRSLRAAARGWCVARALAPATRTGVLVSRPIASATRAATRAASSAPTTTSKRFSTYIRRLVRAEFEKTISERTAQVKYKLNICFNMKSGAF